MKVFTAIIKTMLFCFTVLFCSALATFFLTIFIPNSVLNAFQVIKNLIGG